MASVTNIRRSERLVSKNNFRGVISTKVNKIYKANSARRAINRLSDRRNSCDHSYTFSGVSHATSDNMSEERVASLEKAVGDIKTQVNDVNIQMQDLCKKFDRLLDSPVDTENTDRSAAPTGAARPGHGERGNQPIGGRHSQPTHDMTKDQYVQYEMDRDKFTFFKFLNTPVNIKWASIALNAFSISHICMRTGKAPLL